MALEDILKLIKEEAEKKSQEIIKKAESEADNNLSIAKEEAEKEENNLIQYYKNQAMKEKERVIDNAKLDIKKRILKEKRLLLSLLYEKAVKQLKNLSKDEYLSLIQKLIIENTMSGNEQLIISDNDKYITPAFIKGFNSKNKGFNISLSKEKGDFSGGFLLKTDKQQVDCTFEALITLIREEHEVELAKIFFGENK